jgi:phosphate-selective porin OprO and OprP
LKFRYLIQADAWYFNPSNEKPVTDGFYFPRGRLSANVPFLAFNTNVRERGPRALGELHLAYFYKGLSILGDWDFGFESWAVGICDVRHSG